MQALKVLFLTKIVSTNSVSELKESMQSRRQNSLPLQNQNLVICYIIWQNCEILENLNR